jgi:hypothetical protein
LELISLERRWGWKLESKNNLCVLERRKRKQQQPSPIMYDREHSFVWIIINFVQVKLAIMDDRKSRSLRDQREKEQREARSSAPSRRSPDPLAPAPVMPGPGFVLATGVCADDGDSLDEPSSPSSQ